MLNWWQLTDQVITQMAVAVIAAGLRRNVALPQRHSGLRYLRVTGVLQQAFGRGQVWGASLNAGKEVRHRTIFVNISYNYVLRYILSTHSQQKEKEKMRNKMLVILTIVGVLALTLSACGSEKEVEVTRVVKEEVVVTATPEPRGTAMAKTFNQMVTEAMAEVPVISPEEANRQLQKDPRILVIDPRDAADIPVTGIIPGAMNISYGALTYKADNELPPEWRESELADRSRPIITVCESGELAALAGKLLKDMGFTNVSILEGGTLAWKDAGYPTQ